LSDDNLEPVPPKIIQNIKWLKNNIHRHPKSIVIGLLVLFILTGIPTDFLKENYNQVTEITPVQKYISDSGKKNAYPPQALKVTFLDGAIGVVELTFNAQLVESELERVHSTFGSSEAAANVLKNAVKAAVYSAMESKTIAEVRSSRKEVAKEIIVDTTAAQHKVGYKIFQITIGNISISQT